MSYIGQENKQAALDAGFTETDQAFYGGNFSTQSGSGYDAYVTAKEIDPEAAIQALAMGRYQVLGINVYNDYGSAAAIEAAFSADCDRFSDDVFELWWSGKGSLIRSANSGNLRELVTRYYGEYDSEYEDSIRENMQTYLDNNGQGGGTAASEATDSD